jgi:hypothetical protein
MRNLKIKQIKALSIQKKLFLKFKIFMIFIIYNSFHIENFKLMWIFWSIICLMILMGLFINIFD